MWVVEFLEEEVFAAVEVAGGLVSTMFRGVVMIEFEVVAGDQQGPSAGYFWEYLLKSCFFWCFEVAVLFFDEVCLRSAGMKSGVDIEEQVDMESLGGGVAAVAAVVVVVVMESLRLRLMIFLT